MMTRKHLDEYIKITKSIENIQYEINAYKRTILDNIENAKTEKEQYEKIKEFQKTVVQLKQDPEITQKYRLLKQKQTELKNKIIYFIETHIDNIDNINETKTDIEKMIIHLKIKYNILAKNKIILTDKI
jgi:hypothetical protein